MKTFLKAVLFILIWGVLISGGYVFYEAYSFLNTPASATSREVAFAINPGATFDRVAWDLKKAGLITDVLRFRLLAQYHDALGKVKAGEFLLNTGWTPDKVLYQITQGQAMLYRLSIREGLTWWETARTVEEQGFARYEDFKAVIHDPEFLRRHSIPFNNAEGFLYPETYLLKKPRAPLDREQAREVAEVMARTFWKKTEPIWRELPLRDDLKTEAAPSPGAPLLPASPGAMSSSAPAQGAAPVGKAPDKPAGLQRDLPPAGQGHSGTLESGAVPANVNAALPGVNNVAAPRLPASSGEGGWRATIDPLAPSPGLAVPAETGRQAPPLQAEPLAPAQTHEAAQPGGAAAPQDQEADSSAERADAPQAAPAAPSGEDALQTAPEPVAPEGADGAEQPAPGAPAPKPLPSEAKGPQSPAEVDPKALRRLLTLASLVEKETGVPTERGRVAGVYANRLRANMLLQCDPTIIYGIGPSFSGAIRRSQIDDPQNPYNTYQRPGLPPGPICSPGFLSLQAAFAPEAHDYFYFVATGVDAGHTFSKTLSEHNKAVQVYRERMRGNGGKDKKK